MYSRFSVRNRRLGSSSTARYSERLVHKNKVQQQTHRTTQLQTGRGPNPLSTDRDERHLIPVSLNHRKMTSSDLQRDWRAVAGVKRTASMVLKTGFWRYYQVYSRPYQVSPRYYQVASRYYQVSPRYYQVSPRYYMVYSRYYQVYSRSYQVSPRYYQVYSRYYQVYSRYYQVSPRYYQVYSRYYQVSPRYY
ncbi:hypothetical protein NFI96_006784 [Prochilodus magdalenae]|nr:hypothetical protein NFI96_006784 [Prochilodus magdalenae]